eukprot:Skav213072  [mRNA]  locus=scaffold4152:167812:168093:- [translate_table: standard]
MLDTLDIVAHVVDMEAAGKKSLLSRDVDRAAGSGTMWIPLLRALGRHFLVDPVAQAKEYFKSHNGANLGFLVLGAAALATFFTARAWPRHVGF